MKLLLLSTLILFSFLTTVSAQWQIITKVLAVAESSARAVAGQAGRIAVTGARTMVGTERMARNLVGKMKLPKVSESKVHSIFQKALNRMKEPSSGMKLRMIGSRFKELFSLTKNRIKFFDVFKRVTKKYNEGRFKARESFLEHLCRKKRNLVKYESEREYFVKFLRMFGERGEADRFSTTAGRRYIEDWRQFPTFKFTPEKGNPKQEGYFHALKKSEETIIKRMSEKINSESDLINIRKLMKLVEEALAKRLEVQSHWHPKNEAELRRLKDEINRETDLNKLKELKSEESKLIQKIQNHKVVIDQFREMVANFNNAWNENVEKDKLRKKFFDETKKRYCG